VVAISGTGASVFLSASVSGTATILIDLQSGYSWSNSDANTQILMYSGQILRFTQVNTASFPEISVFQLPTDGSSINAFTYLTAQRALLDFSQGGWIAPAPPVPASNIFYLNSLSSYVLILRFLIYN
jgi:hypothetical protein